MKGFIRKAIVQDTETIKNISRETIDLNYRSFLGDKGVNWFIESGASDQYIDDNLDDCWVIVIDNTIIGFSVCKGNLIDLMMIDHNFHRQGFGTTLLKYCEDYLYTSFNEIRLESFEGNVKANNFYNKNGWIEIERKFDQMSGINKITFIKKAKPMYSK